MQRKSNGSALPMALIMLMVLTILGIAGLRMADTELKIANAVQQFATAFFAAESAVENSIATGTLIDGMTDVPSDITIADGITGQVATNYLDRGPVPGGGYSIANNTYAAYHFQAIGTGTAPNNTNVTVVQGMYLIARGGN
jgi:hypothetical protein